ncbi:MAG: cation transporter [Prevotella sp.]|nr:cation transporter [Prevotella sp.]
MKKIILLGLSMLFSMSISAKDIKTVVVTTQPQMHCENCENRIKGNLRFEKGVKKIETNIEKQQVTITYDAEKTNPETIVNSFEKFGYTATEMGNPIYGITVKDASGQDLSLSNYSGKVLLIVNTATRCGFTPQYKELEALYEKYNAQGFEILDFPCNQFGEQAPGTIQEIHEFCTANFDIRFQQFEKIDVNGPDESPLFTYLKSQQGFGGFDLTDQKGMLMDQMLRRQDTEYDKKPDIKWNFTKFLVSREGRVLKRYEPTDKVSDIEVDIQKQLK